MKLFAILVILFNLLLCSYLFVKCCKNIDIINKSFSDLQSYEKSYFVITLICVIVQIVCFITTVLF